MLSDCIHTDVTDEPERRHMASSDYLHALDASNDSAEVWLVTGTGTRSYEYRDGGSVTEVLVVNALRPDISSEVRESVRAFARQAIFLRASTSRQDLGDIELEPYRALGEHSTSVAFDEWDVHRSRSKRG
jgi:hypothetical protein